MESTEGTVFAGAAPKPDEKASEGSGSRAEASHEPTKILPSTRANTKNQLDFLRAFALQSGSNRAVVTTPDVAKIVEKDNSTVSSCNGFFVEIGLLTKQGRGYIPVADVFEYARAYEWNQDTAPQKLAPVFRSSWAWEALGPRLSFRPLTEDDAVAVLAEACAAGPKYKGSLCTLLDFLTECGLIRKDESGRIVRATEDKPAVPKAKPDAEDSTPKVEQAHTPPKNAMTLSMDLTVAMDDVMKLGPDKVALFFAEWAKLVNAKGAIEGMIRGEAGTMQDA